jgi:hypothetical protein
LTLIAKFPGQVSTMDLTGAMMDIPGLATAEEREEWEHDPSDDIIPTMPDWWHDLTLRRLGGMSPEAMCRKEFEARPPALGLTAADIDALEAHSQDPQLTPVQKRECFQVLRSTLLRQLIPASGCASVADLCGVLRAELESGTPAPVPEWYVFSSTTMGPRKIGYDCCVARGCLKTETVESKFSKCSQCKQAYYCSRECQLSDWKARHKKICKTVSEGREKIAKVGKMMQFLSDASLSGAAGSDPFDMNALFASMRSGQGPIAEAVKSRRKELKDEKNRGRENGGGRGE